MADNESDITLRQLGDLLQARRIELALSAREIARRADIDVNTYLRLERAGNNRPTTMVLDAVAVALDLPVSDLFAVLGWLPQEELPTFAPYLRAKYPDMPPEAAQDIERYFTELAHRHRIADGPTDGRDE